MAGSEEEDKDEKSSRLDQVALEELGETKEVKSSRTSAKIYIFIFSTAEKFCSD